MVFPFFLIIELYYGEIIMDTQNNNNNNDVDKLFDENGMPVKMVDVEYEKQFIEAEENKGTLEEQAEKELTKNLYYTEWKQEANEIIDAVTPTEQVLLNKCINGEQATDEEINLIAEILARYRKAIREQKPEETLENLENNLQIVNDFKTFTKEVKKSKQKGIVQYDFYIPNTNSVVPLDVHPLTDSEVILDINSNLNMYKDLTSDEQIIYTKYQQGEPQTREEQAIAKHIEEKIEQRLNENAVEVMLEFLSNQLSLRGQPKNPTLMREALEDLEIGILSLLTNKVRQIVELDGNLELDKVFRAVSS